MLQKTPKVYWTFGLKIKGLILIVNGISISLGLFYALKLGNRIYGTFIFTIFVWVFKGCFFFCFLFFFLSA